jgi:hypothetical protein
MQRSLGVVVVPVVPIVFSCAGLALPTRTAELTGARFLLLPRTAELLQRK